jgi:hypothetical protein
MLVLIMIRGYLLYSRLLSVTTPRIVGLMGHGSITGHTALFIGLHQPAESQVYSVSAWIFA